MKRTNRKRIFACIGAVIILMSLLSSFTVNAATKKWTTGCYNGYRQTGYTSVILDNPKKDAYINVYNYNIRGKEDNTEFRVYIKDSNGKQLYTANVKSGKKLRLGNDHRSYKIYFSWSPNTFEPIAQVCNKYWAIKAKTNCYMR